MRLTFWGFPRITHSLLGESERKNLSQIAEDSVDVSYHSLRHFLVRASWGEQEINDRRLEVMKSCRQTKPSTGFSLIIIDSGYGNNTSFLKELESRKLKYLGGIAKNRKVTLEKEEITTPKVTPQWVVETYSQRNWVEVFYREAKGWLGLKEYQVRHKRSLLRHFILIFCAYTFILWHKLTGGLRRRWGNKPLNTFPEAMARISYSYLLPFS